MFVKLLSSPVPTVNWCHPTALATPLLLSSLRTLSAGPTPSHAFPDLLEIIDQEASLPSKSASNEFENITLSPVSTPKTDSELVDMVLSMSERAAQKEDIQMAPGTFTYIREEDERRSLRVKGRQMKGRHAKRMTDDEKEFVKRQRSENRAQERERTRLKFLKPKSGSRKSSRTKGEIKYNG